MGVEVTWEVRILCSIVIIIKDYLFVFVHVGYFV